MTGSNQKRRLAAMGTAGSGRDECLALAGSVFCGALICFSLLSYKRNFAILFSALGAIAAYTLIISLWEPEEGCPEFAPGFAGRGGIPVIVAGALLLVVSFLGVLVASVSREAPAGLGVQSMLAGAVGALLAGPVAIPAGWKVASPSPRLSCSHYLLTMAFLGSLVIQIALLAEAGGVAILQGLRNWCMLIAFCSGLTLVLLDGFDDARARGLRSGKSRRDQYQQETHAQGKEQADTA